MAAGTISARRRFGMLVGLAFALGPCLAGPAGAVEPDWPPGIYKYITIDQSVRDALIEFGRNIGVPVRVSDAVKGRLSARMPVGTAKEFLTWICDRYGLVWYFDGSVLSVATEGEVHTEIVKLDVAAMQGVRAKLERLGLTDPRFPVKVLDAENVVSVSGPPAYVALVKKALGVLSGPPATGEASTQGKDVPVRVFRGRHAVAETVPAGSSR